MNVRHLPYRTIVSGLITVACLLADVQASPVEKSIAYNEQQQCGAASPLLLSLGDAYFNIEDTDTDTETRMSAKEFAHNELLSRLDKLSRADGSGVRVICTGSADEIRARSQTFSLERIESRQTAYKDVESAIFITAYEYDRFSRRLLREAVTIPTRSQDLIHLGRQKLATSKRHRQATRIGSYLKETRTRASISDNTITIDQSVYVNGTLAQWHTWTLTD